MKNTEHQKIQYDHGQNLHTLQGATTALPLLLEGLDPRSLLDVGCGTGVWMHAALEHGIKDVIGVDGIVLDEVLCKVPRELIKQYDLTEAWGLERRFDLALCLEVAEHLPASAAASLVTGLVRHADTIIFSAANKWQQGQNHVNNQWPDYWQTLFNERGYVCEDQIRWRIWNVAEIEPWYRQNIFTARKDLDRAGTEPRLPGVIHPALIFSICEDWRRAHTSLPVALVNQASARLRRLLRIRSKNEETP